MSASFLLGGTEARLRHHALVLGPFFGHFPSQPGELLLDVDPLRGDLLEGTPLRQRDPACLLRGLGVGPDGCLEVRSALPASTALRDRDDLARENRCSR